MSSKKTVLFLLLIFSYYQISSQSHEAQVLLLNVAKYESMRQTVNEVRTTYNLLAKWYGKIEAVAKGDLKLHSAFLEGLKAVSPAVAKYHKIGKIIQKQKLIIDHYGDFFSFVKNTDNFSEAEIDYFKTIFNNLLKESGNYIEELFMVITATDMNMSDEERIKVIDNLSNDIDRQINFLSDFNNLTFVVSKERDNEKNEIKVAKAYNESE